MLFLLTNGKYLYVGHEVYEFSTHGDEIISYHSPIGYRDVPYPYAIGKHKTYLLLENVLAENTSLIGTNDKDPYAVYYGSDENVGVAGEALFTQFPVEMIDKKFH
jgi:hypothetical protein